MVFGACLWTRFFYLLDQVVTFFACVVPLFFLLTLFPRFLLF